jgi:hypothetical protein
MMEDSGFRLSIVDPFDYTQGVLPTSILDLFNVTPPEYRL